jgi:hypothetical protein
MKLSSTTQQHDVVDREVDRTVNDETNDDFPALEALLHRPLRREISVAEPPEPQCALQHLD